MGGHYRRPVTSVERERREDVRADKLTALHGRLAVAVAELHSGPEWRRWLDVAGRFHSYSFNNTVAIAIQRPDATVVAGYETWKSLGRQVVKGENGIQILAPVLRRTGDHEDPDNRQASTQASGREGGPPADISAGQAAGRERARQLAGFRIAYVWDLSQTAGDPLPEQPRPRLLTGQAPAGLWDSLTRLVTDRGYTVERGDCGPANGYTHFADRKVRVRADVDDSQAVKTLIHETAHVLLLDPANPDSRSTTGAETTERCRGTQEVEAESIAYLVADAHGLTTDDYTFAYITAWAADVAGGDPGQVVRATAERVLTASRTILAVTQPDPDASGAVATAVAVGVRAAAQRTAAARQHADATRARAQPPTTPDSAAVTPDVEGLARLNGAAAAFYTGQLTGDSPDAAQARGLLEQRGVTAAMVGAYELGYAPPGWTTLTDHLRGAGYTDTQLLAAGVAVATRRGTVLDRFRDRIMFPVHDPAGRVVIGFLGRILVEAAGTPKYLNSPQTALYRKGDVLYGLGAVPTRRALAGGARPVLVEGAFDAIAVTSAGRGRYAGIAPSGTALTAGQVTALDAHAGPLADRGVVVAFDGDPAGRDAALRAFPLLRAAGAWPAAVSLPDGQDPASLARQRGPHALLTALEGSIPLAGLAVELRLARWSDRLSWPEGKVGAARDAAQLIATFPVDQIGRHVAQVAERTGLDTGEVTGAVADTISRTADPAGVPATCDRRRDLAEGQPVTAGTSAVRLARAGYPTPIRAANSTPAAINDPGVAAAVRPTPGVARGVSAGR